MWLFLGISAIIFTGFNLICSFKSLPFKLIVATAWLAYSNVDLFIRGHKKRQEPLRLLPLFIQVSQQSILIQSPAFPIYNSFGLLRRDLFHHLPWHLNAHEEPLSKTQ